MMTKQPVPKVVRFDEAALSLSGPEGVTRYIRARSFLVAMTESADACFVTDSYETEVIVLLPDVGAEIRWSGGAISAPARSVVVLPPGDHTVSIDPGGRVVRLSTSLPLGLKSVPVTADPDGPPLKDVTPTFVRSRQEAAPLIYELDQLPNSPGMPRAKLFQSSTMSINWGPRNRQQLSPHSHEDIEQGSLALAGDFVHHLRTPWLKDANEWRDDLHVECGSGSIALIPPGIIHTTEGVGEMLHVLIDIFAPPRKDFIKKGQILNFSDYTDTLTEV
jgi:mannose-6-phosphate isomerase-like protein (cupin superfamily)